MSLTCLFRSQACGIPRFRTSRAISSSAIAITIRLSYVTQSLIIAKNLIFLLNIQYDMINSVAKGAVAKFRLRNRKHFNLLGNHLTVT